MDDFHLLPVRCREFHHSYDKPFITLWKELRAKRHAHFCTLATCQPPSATFLDAYFCPLHIKFYLASI